MKIRVWWIPQIPMKAFYVPVNSVEEARLVLDMLAKYDMFQFENKNDRFLEINKANEGL